MELEGRIALVTGAGGGGGGQGRAIALALAREGADVAANDLDASYAEATAAEIRALGRRAMAIQADVSNDTQVNEMVARIVREWGGIDILVNNAGFGHPILAEDMTTEEWRRTIGVNLDGPFFCCRAVIPVMKARGGGRIINIASPAGKTMTVHGCAAYTSAKAGVMGLTRHLAFELAPYRITINSICPALMLDYGRGKEPPTLEQVTAMKQKSLMGELTTPEDTASAVLFLVSERAKMITGTNIDVYPVVPGGKDYWDNFVRIRREWRAQKVKK